MFACLSSLSAPPADLVRMAEDVTPRFERVGPLVLLDLSGLSRLFGSPQEMGAQLRRASRGPVRIAIAPTQTAAALLALGRAGLSVILPGELVDALAPLPVTLLGDLDRVRLAAADGLARSAPAPDVPLSSGSEPPPVPRMVSEPSSVRAAAPHRGGGGWQHPRDAHAASRTRWRRPVTPSARPATGASAAARIDIQARLDTLRGWGIRTCGALAALPPGDVYERLGARGVSWQRLARGEDTTTLLVPWVPEDPFEASLDLEWPIEGLEPLSFVLGRLLEPLADRLERADRGAAVLHTHLHLVSKHVHARTLQLPAPMRDPRTLRTLVLLDLETNPPAAAIDRVQVLLEPTPARVTQWQLFERAHPSPEQVSTLLARLTALMGDTHVGSPRLVDSWKPGAFEMRPFAVPAAAGSEARRANPAPEPQAALRRFRLPVPARVQVQDGRPVRVSADRRGLASGAVVQAAGPWRTSGDWWNDTAPRHPRPAPVAPVAPAAPAPPCTAPHPTHLSPLPHLPHPSCWDRDEWDIGLADGTVYRIYVERDVGHWFIEGVVD